LIVHLTALFNSKANLTGEGGQLLVNASFNVLTQFSHMLARLLLQAGLHMQKGKSGLWKHHSCHTIASNALLTTHILKDLLPLK